MKDLYLGGLIDDGSERPDKPITYASHRLTTHGVIVGMTGSGKTGLGIIALEEALLSGIPALVIDPKGDMGNLLLTFPQLRSSDFRPWIDEGEASRKGESPDVLAADTAEMWKSGLAKWNIDGSRIARLRDAAEFTIYTPGSESGVPLNIVGSLAAPDIDWSTDAETGRDEIEGFVSSLLVLAGIPTDPISSREHILLSNLIEASWQAGRDLDLASLIGQVQTPPLRKLGVFDLDTFFPPKDRTKLAMRLNGLIASPSFASWMHGAPLDAQSLLYTPDGSPRAAIIYLQHLTDQERQFIVTLLLSKMVTWLRRQPGTSQLRTLIYMDEVFGFAPPTAEPPSKKPILTILKQARAHGVGMLLSTQNPVDLDYKAMSNAGTWMIGRLQTERDKARILEGLKSSSGTADAASLSELIGDLGTRQFVLHSTAESEPLLFRTRWAMSYLRGPLTRSDVQSLTQDAPERETAATAPVTQKLADNETTVAPQVASGTAVYYLDPAANWASTVGAVPGGTSLEAAIVARVSMLYDDVHAGVNHQEVWESVLHPVTNPLDFDGAATVDYDERDLRSDPPVGATYVLPDAPVDTVSFFKTARSSLQQWAVANRKVEVFKNATLKLYSRVGEERAAFEKRCRDTAEDAADADIAKLKDRYKTRIDRVQDQISKTERRVRELEVDTQAKRQQELVAGAGELLSVFLGGKRRSRGLSGVASRRSQTVRIQERLRSAQEAYSDKTQALDDLETDLAKDVTEITTRWDTTAGQIETLQIGLEKTDVKIDEVALVWVPVG
jgi:hypothetical protein